MRPPSSLAAALIASGTITMADWEEAAARRPEAPERYLVERGLISEAQLARARADAWGLPFIRIDAATEIDDAIPPELARTVRAVAVRVGNRKVVAISDPDDIAVVDAVRRVFREAELAVAPPADIHAALMRLGLPDLEIALREPHTGPEAALPLEQLQEMASAEPAVRIVNIILSDAIRMGASDVHVEAQEDGVRVRFRVDGLLQDAAPFPQALLPGVVSRIKILANLDIAEQRNPQDGQFRVRLGSRTLDVRVSVVPSVFGECAVMRLLDRHTSFGGFAQLGFSEEDERLILDALRRPHGIILITGPTGSGKSTTLTVMLRKLVRPEVKVVTVEDPVEYVVRGAEQVQVNPRAGLTFAAALRAFLRHDPDIICVGEIRDLETAQISVRAALTGHLVLSTLHTNDAAGAIPRLVDMGVEPYLAADAMVLVIAQRLVRRVCRACAREVPVPDALRRLVPGAPQRQLRGEGCAECGGRGYKGRTVIAELIPFDQQLREMVARRTHAEKIKEYAVSRLGRPTLVEDGARRVREGVTTVEGVVRVAPELQGGGGGP